MIRQMRLLNRTYTQRRSNWIVYYQKKNECGTLLREKSNETPVNIGFVREWLSCNANNVAKCKTYIHTIQQWKR